MTHAHNGVPEGFYERMNDAAGFREVSHDSASPDLMTAYMADLLHAIRYCIDPSIGEITTSLHHAEPLSEGEQWTIPLFGSCGFEAAMILRVSKLGACHHTPGAEDETDAARASYLTTAEIGQHERGPLKPEPMRAEHPLDRLLDALGLEFVEGTGDRLRAVEDEPEADAAGSNLPFGGVELPDGAVFLTRALLDDEPALMAYLAQHRARLAEDESR